MLAPLKRAELAQKHPWIRHVTGFHAVYGVILLATGLAHGILAGSGARNDDRESSDGCCS